jgi:hypothetical protein
MATKRCPFCKKKLDEKGHCQNHDCVDYKRTQIIEEAEKDKGENNDTEGQN